MRNENTLIGRFFLCILIFLLCYANSGIAAENEKCLSAALKLPLLGGRTDAPIIPVKVNGMDVAMYISPDYFDGLYMREGGNFFIPPGSIRGKIIENGFQETPAEFTTIDSLEIGGAKVEKPEVFRLPGYVTQSINGRTLVGVIGDYILSNFQVLIDVPHGYMYLLKISDGNDCLSLEKSIVGKETNYVPMKGDQKEIPISIDGIDKMFRINTRGWHR